MRPKLILWLVFGAVAAVWYALDPAAHSIGDVRANAPGSARPPIANVANASPVSPTTHKANASLVRADKPRGD
ncbi:MAG: hypothetical protein ACOYB3_12545 [Azonexus sp.]